MGVEQWWNDDWKGKTEEQGQLAPIPLSLLRISLKVFRD
jgi:hypothetical protein